MRDVVILTIYQACNFDDYVLFIIRMFLAQEISVDNQRTYLIFAVIYFESLKKEEGGTFHILWNSNMKCVSGYNRAISLDTK